MAFGISPEKILSPSSKTTSASRLWSLAMAGGMVPVMLGQSAKPSHRRYGRSPTSGGIGPTRSQSTSATTSSPTRLLLSQIMKVQLQQSVFGSHETKMSGSLKDFLISRRTFLSSGWQSLESEREG
ncbi:hypothetical protein TIFTF001_050626 [Ficus carica]|uniref:Uncharacterized protein n=1 Tax=Ficus carica TaxID=3494 RepID=A0AA87ZV04_FICCA|nr:hypothetical protein TIFTF001_050625 [Ficus carica]GMN29830.1 hypothetical protein TIFTF001_050626 [Ficus carica]